MKEMKKVTKKIAISTKGKDIVLSITIYQNL